MSYDQQSSYQQPWLSEPGPGVGVLSPLDAEKSQRWRLVLGCSSLFLGLLSGFYAYTNLSSVIRARNTVAASGGYIPASAMSVAIAIIAVFCVLALAYVGVGTWNIVARRSTAKAPLIAAIILAAAALILIIVVMTTKSTGGVEISGLGLNALIISRCAIVLRMKKAPAYPAAAEWTNRHGKQVSNEFTTAKVNVISSDDGVLQIRRVGLSITFRGQSYEVDSEMLDPPMSIVVYWQRGPAARARNADDIRRFVTEGLAAGGFTVEIL